MTPEEKQKQLRLRLQMEEEEGHSVPVSMEPGDLATPRGTASHIHGATGFAPDDAGEAGPSDATPDGPDHAESLMTGMGQGMTLGYGDELQGALDAAGEAAGRATGIRALRPKKSEVAEQLDEEVGDVPLGDALAQAYRGGRDQDRQNNQEARDAHGGTYLAGDLLGSAGVPIPGPGAASTLGRGAKAAIGVAKGVGLGGLVGLGSSDADLTKGEVGRAAKDTGVSAALGGGLGVLAEGAGAVKNAFASKTKKAVADALAKITKEKEAEIASALGKGRSKVQEASRDLEVMAREAEALPDGPMKEQAKAYLASPDSVALREKVVGGKLQSAPDRISEMQRLMDEHQALAAGKDAAIEGAHETAIAPLTAGKKVGKFLYNYGTRMGPAMLGGMVGAGHGAGGSIAGMIGGGVVGAIAGHPGTAVKNLLKDPAFRRVAFTALEHTLGTAPEALGKYTAVLTAAAKRGRDALMATDSVLEEQDPEYAATKAALVSGEGEGAPDAVTPAHYGAAQ